MADIRATGIWRSGRAELVLLVAIGLFMGAIGPFGTDVVPPGRRFAYWLICMVGGGLIGVLADRLVTGRLPKIATRTIVVSLAMTPLVTLLVLVTGHQLIVQRLGLLPYLTLLGQVFIVSLAAMAIRALARRRVAPIVETRIVVEPPLPEAEATFRRRLSVRRRTARLIAVEAHDHYLRVHTDAGAELLTMRFADALAELAKVYGYRVHRSWWVSADAITAVRWRRGVGEALLDGELSVPVSRSYIATLRAAGWL